MIKDVHVHTNLSHDGKSTISEYINKALEKGVDEITLTEHYDIYDGIKSDLKTIDVDNYYNEYLKYKDNGLVKLNFGIEIGLQPDISDTVKNMVKSYPFDFIIGSSHITCKKDMSKDLSFFDGLTRHEAYMKYFKEVLENIKIYNDEFDVYGHIDYVVRYGGYSEKEINYDEFKDILDEILNLLISKGKGIEINTSGLRYNLPFMHPNKDIIKRYKELGGKIITIGSDAHFDKDLAADFDLAFDTLRECGFEEYTIFHKRNPEFIKIPRREIKR